MKTIKSYTDLEQSKKLAKILPLESADMFYATETNTLIAEPPYEVKGYKPCIPFTPCWSLAALLNILPTIDDRNAEFCKDIRHDNWHIYYHGTATLPIIDTDRYENLVDACVEMILKLHELKIL